MKVKIVTDGTLGNTKVYDMDEGEIEVQHVASINAISLFDADSKTVPTAKITFKKEIEVEIGALVFTAPPPTDPNVAPSVTE